MLNHYIYFFLQWCSHYILWYNETTFIYSRYNHSISVYLTSLINQFARFIVEEVVDWSLHHMECADQLGVSIRLRYLSRVHTLWLTNYYCSNPTNLFTLMWWKNYCLLKWIMVLLYGSTHYNLVMNINYEIWVSMGPQQYYTSWPTSGKDTRIN